MGGWACLDVGVHIGVDIVIWVCGRWGEGESKGRCVGGWACLDVGVHIGVVHAVQQGEGLGQVIGVLEGGQRVLRLDVVWQGTGRPVAPGKGWVRERPRGRGEEHG